MKLYMKYFSIHLKSTMQYKTSFFLATTGQFLVSFNVFLGALFMFQRFKEVQGFTFNEILLCSGIVLLQFSLAEMVARGFDNFSTIIGNGEFDRIMVRPRNEILQVLGSRVEFSRIGRVIQGVAMAAYGIVKCDVSWDPTKVLTVVFMIIGGTILFAGLFLIYASLCFFTLEGLEFMNIFTDGAREHGKYPIGIYGKRMLQICTFIIPYALVQYYPLLYLLGKGSMWYMFLPLLASLFIIPCYLFWRVGVAHYKSTGS